MKLFFTQKAIQQLQSLDRFHNICLTTSDETGHTSHRAYRSLVLQTNAPTFESFDEVLETHIGQIHVTTQALSMLGNDNRIDFDEFRQVFVLLTDDQMVDDNIYCIDH